MPASVPDLPQACAGSDWLAREGREHRSEILVALLSRFSHDLRTPLNTIVGWAHLLQEGRVDSARSSHVADVLARNARMQTVLLDEFVDDARAVLGVLRLDPVALRVEDIVAHAVERATEVATLNGASIVSRVDVAPAGIEGDKRCLQRLFYRLLAGTARRTRQGGLLELSVRADDGAIRVQIDAPARDADWPEAALLDLRIGSFIAAAHAGDMSISDAPGRASLILRLPRGSGDE